MLAPVLTKEEVLKQANHWLQEHERRCGLEEDYRRECEIVYRRSASCREDGHEAHMQRMRDAVEKLVAGFEHLNQLAKGDYHFPHSIAPTVCCWEYRLETLRERNGVYFNERLIPHASAESFLMGLRLVPGCDRPELFQKIQQSVDDALAETGSVFDLSPPPIDIFTPRATDRFNVANFLNAVHTKEMEDDGHQYIGPCRSCPLLLLADPYLTQLQYDFSALHYKNYVWNVMRALQPRRSWQLWIDIWALLFPSRDRPRNFRSIRA
ncbi:unnamed protein product [Caenorhabditis auriculariae]|uniref:Uncharacterized protein n=1 Tax=Caenorhabditis auriculariae TaxID=2777116 RepID=A0A8S1GNW0_9PELO|nr:unnamed protein product [Caenorhabditis auriculariae]